MKPTLQSKKPQRCGFLLFVVYLSNEKIALGARQKPFLRPSCRLTYSAGAKTAFNEADEVIL
jgi:hypothetical protein